MRHAPGGHLALLCHSTLSGEQGGGHRRRPPALPVCPPNSLHPFSPFGLPAGRCRTRASCWLAPLCLAPLSSPPCAGSLACGCPPCTRQARFASLPAPAGRPHSIPSVRCALFCHILPVNRTSDLLCICRLSQPLTALSSLLAAHTPAHRYCARNPGVMCLCAGAAPPRNAGLPGPFGAGRHGPYLLLQQQ